MTFENYKVKNNASTTLLAGISSSATTLIVATWAGDLFPSTFPFELTLEQFTWTNVTKREIVKCTARTWDTLTVVRSAGYCPASYTALTQTNTAFSFLSGDTVSLRVTANIIEDQNTEIARLETTKLNIEDYQNNTKVYASTSTWNDTYAITLSPPITSYQVGQSFKFLSDVWNTWPASINVNGLWNKTIKKHRDQDLNTWDIEAGQIVTVSYDGTNFQMDSQIATIPTTDVNGLTEDTTGDMDADFALVYDVSAWGNRKQKVSVFRATDDEIDAWTNTKKFITPEQHNKYWISTLLRSDWFTYQAPILVRWASDVPGWICSNVANTTWTVGFVALSSSLSTTFTLSSYIPGSWSNNFYFFNSNKDMRIKFRCRMQDVSDRKWFGICVTATTIHTAQTDVTNGTIRFLWNWWSLFAHNSNWTATSTNISSGITATNWNTYEIIFNPWTDIKFYVNGTLRATHTTNLPSTAISPLLCYGVDMNGRVIETVPPIVSLES